MGFLLLLLLVVLPIAELTVLVQVAGSIGVLDTFGLLVLVSIVGVWLAKRAGLGVVRRLREAQAAGRVPSREVADGALVLLAGALLLLPGFISDVAGIALLLPPVRAGVRTLALRRFRQRSRLVVVGRGPGSPRGPGGRRPGDPRDADVWDAESWEESPSSRRPRPGERELEGPR
jgi:UPF0716 protein FxsA